MKDDNDLTKEMVKSVNEMDMEEVVRLVCLLKTKLNDWLIKVCIQP